MGRVNTRILRNSEDVLLAIDGQVESGMCQEDIIYSPASDHVTARVMSMTFSIESDLRVLLYWHGETNQLILPLEGRGTLDFSKFGGLVNPREEGWSGQVGLRAWSEKEFSLPLRHFHISLELSKQRN